MTAAPGVGDLAEAMPDAALLVDAGGVVVAGNSRAAAAFGTAREALTGYHLAALLPGVETVPGVCRVQAARVDGTDFPAEVYTAPVTPDGGLLLTTVRDRSPVLLLEREFQALLESAPDAMVISDADGVIRRVNRQAEVLLGYTRNELLGRSVDMLVPEGARADHPAHRHGYLQAPVTRPMGAGLQLRAVRKDGGEVPVDIALAVVEAADPGQRLVVSTIRDVTERARLDLELRRSKARADEASQAKNEFLSRMSHELRTPLNSVLGFAQLLELDPLSPDQAEAVGHIRRSGQHLLNLINEVLDIARIEAGRLPLSPEPLQVSEVVAEAVDVMRPLARSAEVDLAHDLSAGDGESARLFVTADRQRLIQVLLNLLSNAVKYNHAGGSVRVRATPSEGGTVRIDVTDTGIGIAAADFDRLFQPFNRLGAEASGIEGTGVGLAVSRGLAEAMSGTLTAASTIGVGSTFSITLPDSPPLPSDATHGTGPVSPAPAADAVEEALRLLYIEDNTPNLRLMERLVARRPAWRLLHAGHGRLGYELAISSPCDLILLDLHLPDMSGLEVLRRLRATPETAHTPVVVLSADATPGQVERLIAAGASDYITKPVDVPRVLRLLDDAAVTVANGIDA